METDEDNANSSLPLTSEARFNLHTWVKRQHGPLSAYQTPEPLWVKVQYTLSHDPGKAQRIFTA